ncbi:MAG TPA: hypothetical protein VM890_16710 [Longimicrobium sp.]|jgi:hypothetical protein|nr:hypothetical protein [Longimicrobium sp.]
MNLIFAAIAISIVVRAFRGGGGRRYQELAPQPPGPLLLEDPRVPRLQAEVDDLRQQVERLAAAESFYAQLQAPAPKPPTAN